MQSKRICSVAGCAKEVDARGWCSTHYSRWRRTGAVELKPRKSGPVGACVADGCDKPRIQRSRYCGMHRWRKYAHGSLGDPTRTDADRFWGHIKKTDSCWNWVGTQNGRGYGFFSVGGRQVQAHRYSYEKLRGRIAEGFQIDHLCRNTLCVNPEHLEPVTAKENTRRMQAANGIGWVVTHCPQGHEYTAENTYVEPKGSRSCKACRLERTRQWRLDNPK